MILMTDNGLDCEAPTCWILGRRMSPTQGLPKTSRQQQSWIRRWQLVLKHPVLLIWVSTPRSFPEQLSTWLCTSRSYRWKYMLSSLTCTASMISTKIMWAFPQILQLKSRVNILCDNDPFAFERLRAQRMRAQRMRAWSDEPSFTSKVDRSLLLDKLGHSCPLYTWAFNWRNWIVINHDNHV